MKIVNYYEAKSDELLEPLPGGNTHIAKVYFELSINGENKSFETGESWGKSKEDAELTAIEKFIDWIRDNDMKLKRDL